MICYQSFGLRSLRTTIYLYSIQANELWFAINPSDYVLCEQHSTNINNNSRCCDLLSILRITFFANNQPQKYQSDLSVVICYQSFGLRSLRTTHACMYLLSEPLWFAINPSDYVLCEQPASMSYTVSNCCDLLSILRITFFANNVNDANGIEKFVVICYQSFGLRSLRTTDLVQSLTR